jgi:hypothetical protein
LSNQVCRNFYLRPYPEGGERNPFALFGTPGLVGWLDLGVEVEVRGSLVFAGYMYVVAGDVLYRIATDKTVVELGNLGTMTGPVGMATNGLDLTVVDGASGYVWDYAAGTYTQIVDPDFPACRTIIHTDGYYLVPLSGSGQIWRSDFNTGLSWEGLAFSTAGADPDPIVALISSNQDVYTIGGRTTQIWVNPGATTEKGCAGTFAIGKGNNAIFWVGKDEFGQGQVLRAVGRASKVISTPAITREIQSWGDLSDIQLFTYEMLDQTHVVITSPQADKTLVYDSTADQWHERSSRILGVDGRWRISTHAFFNNLHIVGDAYNGKLYELRSDAYDEDGEEMVSVRRSPILRSLQNDITIDELQIVTEPGVGLVTGEAQDVDPQAILRWSKDGGRNWSAGVDVPLGKIGETNNRARVLQLGQGDNWVFEITISARVKRVIKDALVEAEQDE